VYSYLTPNDPSSSKAIRAHSADKSRGRKSALSPVQHSKSTFEMSSSRKSPQNFKDRFRHSPKTIADEQLTKLFEELDLHEYLPNFIKEGCLKINDLFFFSESELKELIPLMDPRNRLNKRILELSHGASTSGPSSILTSHTDDIPGTEVTAQHHSNRGHHPRSSSEGNNFIEYSTTGAGDTLTRRQELKEKQQKQEEQNRKGLEVEQSGKRSDVEKKKKRGRATKRSKTKNRIYTNKRRREAKTKD